MTLQEATQVLSKRPQQFSEAEYLEKARGLKKICILRTSWYPEVINALEESCLGYFESLKVPALVIQVQTIPGSFELPLAAEFAAQSGCDLIVALGCVIQGDTPHFDFVCQAVTQGLSHVQISHQIPIGFGVLTVNNLEQAIIRGTKGAEAAQAAFWMYALKGRI